MNSVPKLLFNNNYEFSRDCLNDQRLNENTDEDKWGDSDELRPIEEIPHPYQQIFLQYPSFNIIQSKVFDDVLYTDDSLVISAPTGSGKTTIFELAIVRLLINFEKIQFENNFKIVYISPMKALCEERLVDWHKKFTNFGLNCISVTGDSENVEFQNLLNHNIIITTPEKWDCLTRKWRDNKKLVQVIKLFLIDEIHLLNEGSRGSTVETIVCRMKTIEEANSFHENDNSNHKIRFIAVSATVSNPEDVAEWIGKSPNVKCYKFSDEFRPVKLNKIVLGYPYGPRSTPFKFDLALNYKLQSLMMQYSHGKPTLIFCSTRKIVEMTAQHILQNLTFNLKPEQKQRLAEAVGSISDIKVKNSLLYGVGYHHAGMLPETRRTIENLFRNNELPVLVTTSTLAMGVNLPAHLVIIKSTKCYSNGEFRDYTETALLQMIGRAGRPQFDTTATALILTTIKDKEKFEKMVGGLEPIESNLHHHLTEHLNAEVVLQTITDLDIAMQWLSSTFLYIRAKKNPKYYGLNLTATKEQIDRKLLEMCQIEINKLVKAGMLTIDQNIALKSTPVGTLMAKYYLAFETMKLFTQMNGSEILQQILSLISKCKEFSEMYLRVNDKKCLNVLNKCRNRQTIRFPLNGKIKTIDMKINCIIQAVLGCLDICDHSILSETLKIMRNGERIVRCLIEYLESKQKCYKALLNTIILAKCFHVKLWENSPYVSKQLSGIGNVMSTQLVNAGKTTFQLLSECDPREIELLLNKKAPTGGKILEQIHHLPKYNLKLELSGKKSFNLIMSLENALDLQEHSTVNRNSLMYLLVGDSSNNILLYEKYSHSYMIENPEIVKIIDVKEDNLEEIEAHFISEDWVGIDCNAKYEYIYRQKSNDNIKAKVATPKKKNPDPGITYMQKFMEMYMKHKKNSDSEKQQEIEIVNNDKKSEDANNNKKIIVHSNITINNREKSSEISNEINMGEKTLNVAEGKCEKNESYVENPFACTPKFVSDRSFDLHNVSVVGDNHKTAVKVSEIQKYKFTPKKLTHNVNVEPEVSSRSPNMNYTNTEIIHPKKKLRMKDQSFEEKPKSQTKITWRSPLTYSPPVKFSPKINFDQAKNTFDKNEISHNLSTVSHETSSTSTSNMIQETSTMKSTKSLPSWPLLKLKSSKAGFSFPLSDKDYADSSIDERNENQNHKILEEFGDFVSTSFLENVGLVTSTKQINSTNVSSADYYTQLLTQSSQKNDFKEKKNENYPSQSKNIDRATLHMERNSSNNNSQSQTHIMPNRQNMPNFRSPSIHSNSDINMQLHPELHLEKSSFLEARKMQPDNILKRQNLENFRSPSIHSNSDRNMQLYPELHLEKSNFLDTRKIEPEFLKRQNMENFKSFSPCETQTHIMPDRQNVQNFRSPSIYSNSNVNLRHSQFHPKSDFLNRSQTQTDITLNKQNVENLPSEQTDRERLNFLYRNQFGENCSRNLEPNVPKPHMITNRQSLDNYYSDCNTNARHTQFHPSLSLERSNFLNRSQNDDNFRQPMHYSSFSQNNEKCDVIFPRKLSADRSERSFFSNNLKFSDFGHPSMEDERLRLRNLKKGYCNSESFANSDSFRIEQNPFGQTRDDDEFDFHSESYSNFSFGENDQETHIPNNYALSQENVRNCSPYQRVIPSNAIPDSDLNRSLSPCVSLNLRGNERREYCGRNNTEDPLGTYPGNYVENSNSYEYLRRTIEVEDKRPFDFRRGSVSHIPKQSRQTQTDYSTGYNPNKEIFSSGENHFLDNYPQRIVPPVRSIHNNLLPNYCDNNAKNYLMQKFFSEV